MAVDRDRVPAERLPAADELVDVVLPLRRAALAEAVDVGDRAEVVELVEGRDVRRLPDRAFGGLAVAEQHVGAVVGVDAPRVQRHADAGAEPLPERSGRDVDERQPRRRMALEIGGDLPQLQHVLARERAGRRPGGVQQRRRVAFRQHEAVGLRMLRIVRVESHLGEEQRRDDVGRRETRRRMAGTGLRRRAHRIDAKLCGEIVENGSDGAGMNGRKKFITVSAMRGLRFASVLVLALWIGGLAALALAAPVVFDVLETRDPANGRALAGVRRRRARRPGAVARLVARRRPRSRCWSCAR